MASFLHLKLGRWWLCEENNYVDFSTSSVGGKNDKVLSREIKS